MDLKKERDEKIRLINILYFPFVCFLICIKILGAGQFYEQCPKHGMFVPDQAAVTKHSNIML